MIDRIEKASLGEAKQEAKSNGRIFYKASHYIIFKNSGSSNYNMDPNNFNYKYEKYILVKTKRIFNYFINNNIINNYLELITTTNRQIIN